MVVIGVVVVGVMEIVVVVVGVVVGGVMEVVVVVVVGDVGWWWCCGGSFVFIFQFFGQLNVNKITIY